MHGHIEAMCSVTMYSNSYLWSVKLTSKRNLSLTKKSEWKLILFWGTCIFIIVTLADMDATECEKKRVEYIDDLTDLEKQFAILREQ